MKITLTPEDTARLGLVLEPGEGRVLAFDLDKIMAREAVLLQRVTGLMPEELAEGLQGTAVLDADGQQRYATDADGNEVLDEAGERIPLRRVDIEPLIVFVWMAARRAGCKVPYDEFDFDLMHTDLGDDMAVVEASQGKDESSAATT